MKKMKKLLFFVFGVFATLTLAAQPPMRPQGQRPLPNQFRDFVDHQQRWSMERPQIERKDGKVIITMSEEQFKRMQQIRVTQRYRMSHRRPEPPCVKCKKHHSKQLNKKPY
jgi:hypothetical protein